MIAAHLVEGLPSEGTALIGPPPGTRLNHPRATGPTQGATTPAGTRSARVPAPAAVALDH